MNIPIELVENINCCNVEIFNLIIIWDKISSYSVIQGFKKCNI